MRSRNTPFCGQPISFRRGQGFSLIELMVALLLGVFLIGAVILTYLSSRSAAADAEQISRMQENARFAVEYIIRDLRNAGYADELDALLWSRQYVRGLFADVTGEGNDTLTIRYLGRGHCTDVFREVKVVQNVYSVNTDDQLVCEGFAVEEGDDDFVSGGSVALLTGVTGLQFSPICPADEPNCDCSIASEDISNSCIGMQVSLNFGGLRVGGAVDSRSIVFQAAFRNIILERIKVGVPVPSSS